ncbi:hypothetical protein QZG57_08345 [Corynebacterium glucuronolyticum]|uniref:hypothetical protein n=1 Tax=Corynebacterium glucuronolyticum TaxID=39791 RepID=UPI00223AA2AD|nr:hypothetical protein [Corynebacterium glucuronolyticum]MCT1564272.1 hypothetical protein [Corynebacterium glucuronolyticum]
MRTRGRQVFVATPLDVLACRTVPADVSQLTTQVSTLVDAEGSSVDKTQRDGESRQQRDDERLQPCDEGAWLWPGALPPETGFELLDMVSADDAVAFAEAIRDQVRGLTKVPASLLDQQSLTVSGRGIPNRVILASHSLGFFPSPMRVSHAGRWIRVDCMNGTVYWGKLSLYPAQDN